MAGRKVGYVFGNESDLDNALLAGRLVRGVHLTGGRVPSSSYQRPVFAKVDTGQSGFDVTATEVVWDSEASGGDGDFVAPTGTAWRWNTTANNANEDYTTTNLRSTTSLSADDVVEVVLYGDKSETTQWLVRPGGGGGSLVYATSPNTTLDATYTSGAEFDRPGGTGTALSTANFYLSTPWNTRVTAPTALFAWWNKLGTDYYLAVDDFYCKPSANYTENAGVSTFTCYYNDNSSLSLGTNTAFPSGVKVVSEGFDAVNASSNSQAYFNGTIFPARYDSANNIIYIDHHKF